MAHIRRFDHVGITVADLDRVTEFFVELGLEVEGRTFVEGEFVDTVIGIPGTRSHIVTLPPLGGIGQHENIWRMAYVRGPEGLIVSLAERIG